MLAQSRTSHRQRRSWRRRTTGGPDTTTPASTPWRSVSPAFWKKPRPLIGEETAMMSSVFVVRNRPAVHCSCLLGPHDASLPRRPSSQVCETTCLQRRIGREEAFDQARGLGIGAGELGRRRRAVRLRVAAVQRQAWHQLVGGAGHRIEAVVLVRAGELVLLVRIGILVLQIDVRVVPAAAHGERSSLVRSVVLEK